MTRTGRPALNLIPGGLPLVPLAPSTPTANAPRSASRIVAAAQQWAAMMIESGRVDQLDPDASELGRATLALLDSVNEYEAHAAGMIPRGHGEGPAATLW